MKNNKYIDSSGVTLIELIISVFILSMLTSGLANVFKLSTEAISDNSENKYRNALDSIIERTFKNDASLSDGVVVASSQGLDKNILCTSWLAGSSFNQVYPLITFYVKKSYIGYEVRNKDQTGELWRLNCNSIGTTSQIDQAIRVTGNLPLPNDSEWSSKQHFGFSGNLVTSENYDFNNFGNFKFPFNRYIALYRNEVLQTLTVEIANQLNPIISISNSSDLVHGMFLQGFQTDVNTNWPNQFDITTTISSIIGKDLIITGNSKSINASVNWVIKFYSPKAIQFKLPLVNSSNINLIHASKRVGAV